MTSLVKTSAKTFFETGDKPTQAHFGNLIDSCAFLAETTAQTFAGSIAVSGSLTGYGGGTLNTFTINSPSIFNPTIDSATINIPTVSAGTFASPSLTGTPVAPTATANTNTTQIATTAFVLGQAATQAQMETATSNTNFVTPGRAQNHPGVAKVWALVSGGVTATLVTSYNVSSVSRLSQGRVQVKFNTPFSGSLYAAIANTSDGFCDAVVSSDTAAGSCVVRAFVLANGSATDVDFSMVAYGDQ